MRLIKLLISVYFFCSIGLLSVRASSISGKVIDNVSKQSLLWVTITIGNNVSTTDSFGFFSIHFIKDKNTLPCEASFSCVGYKTLHLNLKNIQDSSFLLIKLEAISNNLPAIIVSTGSKAILKKAIDRIPHNYDTTSYSMIGYMRIYETINDSSYFFKGDALINLPYISYTKPKERLAVQLLQNKNFVVDNFDTISKGPLFFKQKKSLKPNVGWKSEYYTQSYIDFVYHHSFLADINQLDKIEVSPPIKVAYNGINVYAIDFVHKDYKPGIEGTVYIDTATFAFVGIYYYIVDEYLLNKNPHQLVTKLQRTYVSWQINYQKVNNKWYYKNSHTEQRSLNQSKSYTLKSIGDFVSLNIDTLAKETNNNFKLIKQSDKAADFNIYGNENKWIWAEDILNKENLKQFLTEIPFPKRKHE